MRQVSSTNSWPNLSLPAQGPEHCRCSIRRTGLDDGVGLPGGVLTFQAPGDDCAEWMIVAGSSDVDPWIHVDSAPEWVQELFDVTARPALVAWGQPGRWETSEGRIELEEAGHVAIADLERPWLTDGIADDIAPVLSNEGDS